MSHLYIDRSDFQDPSELEKMKDRVWSTAMLDDAISALLDFENDFEKRTLVYAAIRKAIKGHPLDLTLMLDEYVEQISIGELGELDE